eukprot:TRINITY_DN1620_c0_g1_i3.p1 TRINITY_DN1620_c0_g1~~TRINITY_DN1620_c0_g1_i3.p1  ORF type:complete len:354 (+),score=111.15 TRINITY_DN1620_c0_g1_i3:34-1062(+)
MEEVSKPGEEKEVSRPGEHEEKELGEEKEVSKPGEHEEKMEEVSKPGEQEKEVSRPGEHEEKELGEEKEVSKPGEHEEKMEEVSKPGEEKEVSRPGEHEEKELGEEKEVSKPGEDKLVSKPGEYEACLKEQRKVRVVGLMGRIVRGKEPAHFSNLSTELWKKLSWVMGEDSLEVMVTMKDWELLQHVGILKEWATQYLKNGYKFSFLVFTSTEAKLATWSNLFLLIDEYYPDVSQKVRKWEQTLIETPWEKVKALAGFDHLAVSMKGREVDDHYISYQRLKEREGTFIEVRSFIYFEIGAKELFRGDGYAYSEAGQQGAKEYLTPNVPVQNMEHIYHDLKLD